ncbi:MAG: hypothetical protein ACFFD2_24415 [Promethearchaeota archaeon]
MIKINTNFEDLSEKAREILLETIKYLRFNELENDGENLTMYSNKLSIPRNILPIFEVQIEASGFIYSLYVDLAADLSKEYDEDIADILADNIADEVDMEISSWFDWVHDAKIDYIVVDEDLFSKVGLKAESLDSKKKRND